MLIPHTSGDWKSKIRATAWSVLVTTLFLTVSSHGRMRRRQKAFWSLGGGGVVTKSCLTLATPWTIACQAPLSVGYSRQEYWSGLPFPSPGDLPNPGIEPRPPALQADSLPPELQGKPWSLSYKGSNPFTGALHSQPNYLPKALFPNTIITWGVRTSIYEFGGHKIQSLAPLFRQWPFCCWLGSELLWL